MSPRSTRYPLNIGAGPIVDGNKGSLAFASRAHPKWGLLAWYPGVKAAKAAEAKAESKEGAASTAPPEKAEESEAADVVTNDDTESDDENGGAP